MGDKNCCVSRMPNFAPPPNPDTPKWDKATYKEILTGYHKALASSENRGNSDNVTINEQDTSIINDNVDNYSLPEKLSDEMLIPSEILQNDFFKEKNTDLKPNKALTNARPFACQLYDQTMKAKRKCKSSQYIRTKQRFSSRSMSTKRRLSNISSISDLTYCQKCIDDGVACFRIENNFTYVQHFKDASCQTQGTIETSNDHDLNSSYSEFDIIEKNKNDKFVSDMIDFENRCSDTYTDENLCSTVDSDNNPTIESDTDSELEIFIHPDASKIDERLFFLGLILFI